MYDFRSSHLWWGVCRVNGGREKRVNFSYHLSLGEGVRGRVRGEGKGKVRGDGRIYRVYSLLLLRDDGDMISLLRKVHGIPDILKIDIVEKSEHDVCMIWKKIEDL